MLRPRFLAGGAALALLFVPTAPALAQLKKPARVEIKLEKKGVKKKCGARALQNPIEFDAADHDGVQWFITNGCGNVKEPIEVVVPEDDHPFAKKCYHLWQGNLTQYKECALKKNPYAASYHYDLLIDKRPFDPQIIVRRDKYVLDVRLALQGAECAVAQPPGGQGTFPHDGSWKQLVLRVESACPGPRAVAVAFTTSPLAGDCQLSINLDGPGVAGDMVCDIRPDAPAMSYPYTVGVR